MATFQKFDRFQEDFANKVHDFFGTQDTIKALLSNTTPNISTMAVKADVTELGAGNGYSAGGVDSQNDATRSGATVTGTAVDFTITASGGTIGPFRYVYFYNDTPTSPADPLIGVVDYGSAITLNDGDSLVVDFGATFYTVT
jgi:hypothetical protein